MSQNSPPLEERAIAAWMKRRLLPRAAASQLLAATEALTLACLASLARLREAGGYARLLADTKSLQIRAGRAPEPERDPALATR